MTYSDHITTETLADHAEGLLGESEAGRVQSHLDDCADCRSTALMLASLSEILAADDPGPMPAQYVARINSTLAELAVTEPVVPSKTGASSASAAPAAAGGAQVIHLASRRKIVVTGLRRVSTVAAGVVLLIGGAALGIQTIGNRGEQPGPGTQALNPVPTEGTRYTAEVFDIPTNAVPDKHGNYVAPNGTIYVPSAGAGKKANKVIQPNGDVIVQSAAGNPIVEKPVPAAPPQTGSKPSNQLDTAKGPNHRPQPQSPQGNPGAPGDIAAPPATSAPNATAPASPGPAAVAPNSSGNNNPRITEKPGRSEGDPYVTQSGTAYTEDNFAGKVRDLVTEAEQHSNPNDNGPAPAGSTVSDPAAPPDTAPTDTTASDTTPKHLGDQQDVTADYKAPTAAIKPAAHGPASPNVQARVLRCAAQTGRTAIAGDEGTWANRKATIVVVQSDRPDQVIGYVFYGECNQRGPVTAQDSPWEQRVDKPGSPTAQSTSPPKRAGDVTTSQTQVNSSAPATRPPAGVDSVTPDEEQS